MSSTHNLHTANFASGPLPRSKQLLLGAWKSLRRNGWQVLAILFCFFFGLAMIVNTQMAGEGVWFWYTNAFRHGAKLYADLHLAMQPLYILETDAWTRLFGIKCFIFEIPAAIHVLLYALGIFMVLRESPWPDWQKAITLAGAFTLCVFGHNYRLDDYHIVAEVLVIYSLAILLILARTQTSSKQTRLAAILGLLSGLTITSRVTDGAAILVVSGICLMFLVRSRRLILMSIFGLVAGLTVLGVVKLTGDTFADYVSNTLIKAAGSKGGTGSIFAAPLVLVRNDVHLLFSGGKGLVVFIAGLISAGAFAYRRWRLALGSIVLLQVGLVALSGFWSHAWRSQLLHGGLIPELILCSIAVTYLLPIFVAVRFARTHRELAGRKWDPREILVLVPLAIWASFSAGSAGEPLTQYYAPVALLLLLFPVLQPFPRHAIWVNASFVMMMVLVGFTSANSKIQNPYSWNDVQTNPMFVNRVWYKHPIYGPLYIDRDDLQFNQSICSHLGNETELLGLPYPYANYFCAVPPWHGYVQTYFDTTPRATVEQLIRELNASPPKWIVYQRQMHIMAGAERFYNHGQPLAQRDLDALIMRNIAMGRWRLVVKRDYPAILNANEYLPGDGWYVVRTRQ